MKRSIIDTKKVHEMAAAGMTVAEIGRAFDMSKSTFLRRKDSNPELQASYEAGLKEFIARTSGREIVKKGGSWATNGFTMPVDPVENYAELVLKYLAEHPADRRFHAIRRALKITSDELSAIMAKLILDTKEIKMRRDAHGDAWYYLTTNQGAAHEGFNWSRSVGLTAAAATA